MGESTARQSTKPKGVALVYCRVSTKEQEEGGTSLDSQESAGRAHAESLGYTVGRVTREVYSGAELWDRPLLSRDRKGIDAGKFQAVVAYSTDRLSRKPVHLMIIVDQCERAGVALIFVTETLDSTPEGMLMQHVRGFVSEVEREKIRERTLRGKRQRALNGSIHNMGPELYGWVRDREAGVRRIHEPEAAVVRRTYTLVAHEYRSLYSIARQLNSEDVPAPGAARMALIDPSRRVYWTAGTVWRIVRDTVYKGEAYAWRWQQLRRPDGSYYQIERPLEERIPLPAGVVPAIVSEELWQQAQDAVQKQKGDRTRNEQIPYLLRGLVYCGHCGRKMWASWQRRNGSNPHAPKVRTYRCSSHNSPEGLCGGRVVNAEKCETWVWEQVSSALRNPDLIAAEAKRKQEEGPDETLTADLEATRRELAKRDKKQADLMRRFTSSDDDTFPWEVVQHEVARLEREKRQLRAELDEMEGRLRAQEAATHQLEALAIYCARVAGNLDTFGFTEKRLALEALRVRVSADGQKWTLTGAVPVGEGGQDEGSRSDVLSQAPAGSQRRRDW
jgi:site-specific DNA recombinase